MLRSRRFPVGVPRLKPIVNVRSTIAAHLRTSLSSDPGTSCKLLPAALNPKTSSMLGYTALATLGTVVSYKLQWHRDYDASCASVPYFLMVFRDPPPFLYGALGTAFYASGFQGWTMARDYVLRGQALRGLFWVFAALCTVHIATLLMVIAANRFQCRAKGRESPLISWQSIVP